MEANALNAFWEETDDIVAQYPKGQHLTKDVLLQCFATIKPWLDIGVLTGYLMKYDVVRNSEDMELVTSPHYEPQDRMAFMVSMLERSGRYGFLAFYAALNESAEEARGHRDALAEMNILVDKVSSEQPVNRGDVISLPPPEDDLEQKELPVSQNAFRSGDVNTDYQISHLEDLFCTISSSLHEEIVEKDMETKDVLKHLVSLPYSLKRELADLIQHQINELKKIKRVNEVHLQSDKKLWNFMDYYLLEHIINKVGSSDLRIKMTEYVTELTHFMQKTTIANLTKFWPGKQDCPLQYDKMCIKIDINPEKCTLERLNTIRKRFCGYFLPPLSEYALFYYKFKKGSFQITFLFARDFIPVFIKKVCSPECYTFFEEHEIVAVTLKGISVYPISVNMPPARGSKSERLGDTYYSLTKLAQEHFCIISNSSLSRIAGPSIHALQQLIHQFITYMKSGVMTASHIIEAFPKLPCDLKPTYTSFLENLNEGSYSILSNESDYVRIFSLIKIALNEFGDDQLTGDLESYLYHLQQIRGMVPLHHILDAWERSGAGNLPLSHTAVSMKLHKDPTDFTLGDIEDLRLAVISEFSHCLSGSMSLVIHSISRGSTIVSWGVHRRDALLLYKVLLTDSNRDFFEKHGVDHVILHNQKAFDKNSIPPVLLLIQTSSYTRILNVEAPNIDINKERQIVLTYKPKWYSKNTFWRTGRSCSDGEEINWMAKELSYYSGKLSVIKMNDSGTIVETFQSRLFKRCYYHIGRFDKDTHTIKWTGSPFYFSSGSNPYVTLNNRGTVVVTVDKGIIRRDTLYRIGCVNESNGIISWRSNFTLFRRNCCNASSSLNDHGIVVLSIRTYAMSFSIFVGQLKGSIICFQSVIDPCSQYGACLFASVALNNSGNIVWVKAQQKQVFLITGRVLQPNDSETAGLKCKLRLNTLRILERQLQFPHVCVSHSGIVGLSYQAKLQRNTRFSSRSLSTVYSFTGTLVHPDILEMVEDSSVNFFPDN